MAEPAPQSPSPMRFEDGLARLERLVHELEDGQLGLEEALRAYEEGIGLLRHCHTLLGEAERKIEILSGFDAEGNAVTRPFPAAGATEKRPAPQPPSMAEGPKAIEPSDNRPQRPARTAPRSERPEDEGPRLF